MIPNLYQTDRLLHLQGTNDREPGEQTKPGVYRSNWAGMIPLMVMKRVRYWWSAPFFGRLYRTSRSLGLRPCGCERLTYP